MAIEKELLDQLLEGRDPETVFTQDGLLDELKKGLSERVLNAELDADLDSSFDIEPVGEMEVKGRTAPVRVYRLVGTVKALATQA